MIITNLHRTGLVLSSLVAVSSCASYEAKPLNEELLLQHAQEKIKQSPQATKRKAANFAMFWQHLLKNNGELELARLELKARQQLSEIGIPLKNPSVGLGLAHALKLDEKSANRTQPGFTFNWEIPLNGSRSLQQDLLELDSVEANAQRKLLISALFLRLRSLWLQQHNLQQRVHLQKQTMQILKQALKMQKKQQQAGYASAPEFHRLKLEMSLQERKSWQLKRDSAEIRQQVELLLQAKLPSQWHVVSSENLNWPKKGFGKNFLQQILEQQPQLQQLKREYAQAEKQLQLEIRRQYPNLQLGTGIADDAGEDVRTLSLGVTMELPIFDRNQQGIAKAKAERQRLQHQYQLALQHALLTGSHLYRQWNSLLREQRFLSKNVLPQGELLTQSLMDAIKAGQGDVQRYWDSRLQQLQLAEEKLHLEQQATSQWLQLEQLAGRPLFSLIPSDLTLFQSLSQERTK